MPKKETENQNQSSEHFTIEKLKEICKTSSAVHEGICAANGWQKGRMVSISEYKEASSRFLTSGIRGKRK